MIKVANLTASISRQGGGIFDAVLRLAQSHDRKKFDERAFGLRDAATEFARHRGSQACSEFLAKLLVAMVFESKTNFSRFVTGLPAASWQYADGEKWKIEGRGEVQVEVSGKWVRVNSPKAKDDSWLL